MRYIMCLCCSSGLLVGQAVAEEASESAPDADLVKRVQDRTSDVTSAKLTFLHFHFGPVVHEKHKIEKTSEEIESLVDASDLANGDDAKFREFLKSYGGISLDDPAHVGADGKPLTLRGEFLWSGQKTREQQDGRVQTFDGADMVSTDVADNQTLIGHPSQVQLKRMSLDDFCTLMSPERLNEFIVLSKENSTVSLRTRNGLAEIVLERETGLLRRLREYTRDGRLKFEILQVGTFPHPTIPFPKATVQVNYTEKQTAKKISASVVMNAQFNIEIPDDAFHHGVAAGVKVVDLRENPQQPTIGFTARSVPNVLAGYEKQGHLGTADAAARQGTSRRWLLTLNFGIIAAIGILLFYRRRRGAHS